MEQVIAVGVPSIIPPGYDVYVDDGRLIYDKDPCEPTHTEMSFFLHTVRQMPECDISVIRPGQSIREETGWRRSWEAEYRFER